MQHADLPCSAVEIDFSGLDALQISHWFKEASITLLSEIGRPEMDRLAFTALLQELTGQVVLSHFEATQALSDATRTEAATE